MTMGKTIRRSWVGASILTVLILAAAPGFLAASQQAEKAEPVRATGDIKPPKLLKMVEPVYPEDAKKEGIEGTVILEATADLKGHVEKVTVLRSVPALDQAAVDAVKQWIYEPMIIDGKPKPVVFTVTVRFALDKDKKGAKEGAMKGPKLVKQVTPVYPEDARKQGIEGTVVLELTTDVEGKVQEAKVLRSIPALDQAAIDAVKQWVYEPMIIEGKPKPFVFTVTVRFALK
jgi:TonB family protein